MNRSEGREAAFKLLYSLQISQSENLEEQEDLFITEEEIGSKEAMR